MFGALEHDHGVHSCSPGGAAEDLIHDLIVAVLAGMVEQEQSGPALPRELNHGIEGIGSLGVVVGLLDAQQPLRRVYDNEHWAMLFYRLAQPCDCSAGARSMQKYRSSSAVIASFRSDDFQPPRAPSSARYSTGPFSVCRLRNDSPRATRSARFSARVDLPPLGRPARIAVPPVGRRPSRTKVRSSPSDSASRSLARMKRADCEDSTFWVREIERALRTSTSNSSTVCSSLSQSCTSLPSLRSAKRSTTRTSIFG